MTSNNTSHTISTDRLDLFCGALNPAVGRVYARWSDADEAGLTLSGTLLGPSCLYADTLPATSRFIDRGPGGPPLAEAIVPEPTYWTPEMPHLYQATLELRRGASVLARAERMFGFRPLGATGARLRLDGKPWVLRGVVAGGVDADGLAPFRQADVALVTGCPADALCAAASRQGVLIVAELPDFELSELRRLSRWPAVGLVSLPAEATPELRTLGHNLLLAQRFAIGQKIKPAYWADLAICELEEINDTTAAWPQTSSTKPLIAMRRPATGGAPVSRAACDRLQAELAPCGQLAGYIC